MRIAILRRTYALFPTASLLLVAGLAACLAELPTDSSFSHIYLAVHPESASVEVGNRTTTTVMISRSDHVVGSIALWVDGAPAGIQTTLLGIRAGDTSSVLSIDVGAETAPGTYSLTVVGSQSGFPDGSAKFTLIVTRPMATFPQRN